MLFLPGRRRRACHTCIYPLYSAPLVNRPLSTGKKSPKNFNVSSGNVYK